MTDPARLPDQIIAETEARFPMPAAEMERLKNRRWILGRLPRGGIGAEIGVFRGHFSALICEAAAPRKLYMIDPWTRLGPTFGWGKDYTNFDTLTTEAARNEAAARVARFPGVEAVLIEDNYPACSARIAEPLDFAYLDASHKYAATLHELRRLQHQMAPAGLILGDDWHPDPGHIHHGVYRAVQDFVRETDWEIVAAGPAAQWLLRRRLPAPG